MKIKKILSLAVLAILGVYSAKALDLTTVMEGTVESKVEYPTTVTTLTVTGPVDAADLFFIGQKMTELKTLDLSGAVIKPYNHTRLHGKTHYDEAVIPAGSFAGSPVNTVVFPTQSGLVIDHGAFMHSGLTKLSIPANVDSIGQAAFEHCDALTTVDMPSCRLGSAVFADCANLTVVNMGKVTVIPDYTFRGCSSLTTVNGASDVVSIGDKAFEGDKALTDFAFGKALKHIGASAFAGTGLTSAQLESSKLDAIGDEAFAHAPIEDLTLPENLSHIGNGAFFGLTEAGEIKLPSGLITIGEHAFNGINLTELKLPATLEEIGAYALAGQNNVHTLWMPPTLLYIGDHAMEDMTGLEYIDGTALTAVPELGEDVWNGVNKSEVKLKIFEDYTDDFRNAPQWNEFSIDVATDVVDSIVNGEKPAVQGRFVGTDLQVVSTGSEIDIVRLYDVSGRLLLSVEPRAFEATIDTSDLQGNIFIINAVLENNVTASIKLARR